MQARIDTYHRQLAAKVLDVRTTAGPATPLEQPLAAGKLALGFMASLGGALLIFLLAAGHVGDEMDLSDHQDPAVPGGQAGAGAGRQGRQRVDAGSAIWVVDWIVLRGQPEHRKPPIRCPAQACLGPRPGRPSPPTWPGPPLILGVWTVLGVGAAVIVRNALGAFAVCGAVLLASLMAAGNFAAVAPWTLAWWVSGWMPFRPMAS